MVGDDSTGSSHACDGVHGMEVLRIGLQSQNAAFRALAESVDCRF